MISCIVMYLHWYLGYQVSLFHFSLLSCGFYHFTLLLLVNFTSLLPFELQVTQYIPYCEVVAAKVLDIKSEELVLSNPG